MSVKKLQEKSSQTHWYALALIDIFRKLKSNKAGLSTKEVESRQKKLGYNTIPTDKPFSSLIILLN